MVGGDQAGRRLCQELRARGYSGGYTTVTDVLQGPASVPVARLCGSVRAPRQHQHIRIVIHMIATACRLEITLADPSCIH